MENDFLKEIQAVLQSGIEEGILPENISLDDVLADNEDDCD